MILKNKKHLLWAIIAIGAVVRIMFLLFGAKYYYGQKIYINYDSFSYTNSFINLWKNGSYAIWLDSPDSYMGRTPGYPLFWGLHYLIFGESYVYIAIAISQILLDILAIKLFFDILKKITNNYKISLFGCLIYSLYPFIIIWLTITGTEAFASFLVILLLWIFYTRKETFRKYFFLGIILSYATLTRPYLGLLLPLQIISVIGKKDLTFRFKYILVVSSTFIFSYSFWPLRNYINHKQIVVFNVPSSGYYNFQKDFIAFRTWVNAWEPYSLKVNQYLYEIINSKNKLQVPDFVFNNKDEKQLFDSLIYLCRNCGSSFYYWKYYSIYKGKSCNEDIEKGFEKLKGSFIKHNPFHYYIKTPIVTFIRAVFKFKTATFNPAFLKMLFYYRTLLIILGFLGSFLLIKKYHLALITMFPILWYLYLCFTHSHFEVRYMLQADIILLFDTLLLIYFITNKLHLKKKLIPEKSV